jgi:hypothetical protein
MNGEPFYRERFIFDQTRASGRVIRIIDRTRKLDPQFRLTLSGKF